MFKSQQRWHLPVWLLNYDFKIQTHLLLYLEPLLSPNEMFTALGRQLSWESKKRFISKISRKETYDRGFDMYQQLNVPSINALHSQTLNHTI